METFCNRLNINHTDQKSQFFFSSALFVGVKNIKISYLNMWRREKVELEPKCKYLCENIMQRASIVHLTHS